MKTCSKCGQEKSLSEFHSRSDSVGKYHAACKACMRVAANKSSKSRKGVQLPAGDQRHGSNGFFSYGCRCDRCQVEGFRTDLRRRFNITEEWYASKLIEQGFGCAICARRGVKLQVDHDHDCCTDRSRSCGECVRGLLCVSCNTALGSFRDKRSTLSAAIEYLDSTV